MIRLIYLILCINVSFKVHSSYFAPSNTSTHFGITTRFVPRWWRNASVLDKFWCIFPLTQFILYFLPKWSIITSLSVIYRYSFQYVHMTKCLLCVQLCTLALLCSSSPCPSIPTFGIMSSMNFCPPKPGSTVMTSAMSMWLAHGASSSTVVPGLMAKPTCSIYTIWMSRHHKVQLPRVILPLTSSPSSHSLWSPWWGFQGWWWPLSGMCTDWLQLQPWASPTAPAETPSCACLQHWQSQYGSPLHHLTIRRSIQWHGQFMKWMWRCSWFLTKEGVFAYTLPQALHHGMAKG